MTPYHSGPEQKMSPVFGNNDAKISQKRLESRRPSSFLFVILFMNDDWSEKREWRRGNYWPNFLSPLDELNLALLSNSHYQASCFHSSLAWCLPEISECLFPAINWTIFRVTARQYSKLMSRVTQSVEVVSFQSK